MTPVTSNAVEPVISAVGDDQVNALRRHVLVLVAGALAVPLASFAQQPTKIPRIGFLQTGRACPRRLDSTERPRHVKPRERSGGAVPIS
jgi:hypothetical protein